MEKPKNYELGLVCGRFGIEHIGHVELIQTALSLAKKTLVLVGSAQEYYTLRNPFKVETRIKVIYKTFPEYSEDVLIVKGLDDRTNELDINEGWGKYVKENVEAITGGKFADLMVYGNDEFRSKWFSKKDIAFTSELIIPRSKLPISATLLRGYMVIDNEENWKKLTHPNIHSMYQELREELMNVPVYKEIYDKLCQSDSINIDSFLEIYKTYEDEDKAKKLAELN